MAMSKEGKELSEKDLLKTCDYAFDEILRKWKRYPRMRNEIIQAHQQIRQLIEKPEKRVTIEMGLGNIGVCSAIRDEIPLLILTKLKSIVPPGQLVPDLKVGDHIPEDSVILEIKFSKTESIMSLINALCGIWRNLIDKEAGVKIVSGKGGKQRE